VNEIDSSTVLLLLDVHPGSQVVESGTGSGCMSLALARAVSPNGKVHSFEFNSVRAETAREEFKKYKIICVLLTLSHFFYSIL
jgi:tRNA (adenine57-N1/adenine58-N1)-methyltransferase